MNSLRIKEIMIRTISLAVLFLSLSAVGTFGQETVLERKEFDEIVKNGWDKLDGKKYRSANLVERFTDKSKPADNSYELVNENLPPERSRSVFIRKNGSTVFTNEHIKIGPRNYYRNNGGEWSEKSSSAGGFASAGTSERTYESYKIIEKSKLDNEKVTVYEAVTKDTHFTGDNQHEEIVTKRYWVDSKGLILKTVVETETVGTKEFSRSTTTYDFDGKFQIEAPIK